MIKGYKALEKLWLKHQKALREAGAFKPETVLPEHLEEATIADIDPVPIVGAYRYCGAELKVYKLDTIIETVGDFRKNRAYLRGNTSLYDTNVNNLILLPNKKFSSLPELITTE